MFVAPGGRPPGLINNGLIDIGGNKIASSQTTEHDQFHNIKPICKIANHGWVEQVFCQKEHEQIFFPDIAHIPKLFGTNFNLIFFLKNVSCKLTKVKDTGQHACLV